MGLQSVSKVAAKIFFCFVKDSVIFFYNCLCRSWPFGNSEHLSLTWKSYSSVATSALQSFQGDESREIEVADWRPAQDT